MLFKLFLLFVVLPLVELSLLLMVGDMTNWYTPILIVLVTGAIGATLAKTQGLQTYQRIQDELRQGKMPADAMLDGVMILLAGAVLLTPGLITDTVGLLLLVPQFRAFVRPRVVNWFTGRMTITTFGASSFDEDEPEERDDVVDSYVVEKKDEE